MAESILIVDDEPAVAELVCINLEAEGYDCHVASRGDDAIQLALDLRPDLVILDLMLPGVDGVEVCRQLRKDPRTSTVGIIMLTARSLPKDRISGLEAGADDYVDKPFDVDELVARVHTSLRRARHLRATSPLTGLPGNFEIEARLDSKLADGVDFALLHVDLDGFKSYNDHYGFLRGDRAIVLTSRVIAQAVEAVEDPDSFVGHIGGDDFVVVCTVDRAEDMARMIVTRFDDQVDDLYDAEDRAVGFIELADRAGQLHRRPFLSVSIGIASSNVRPFVSSAEVAAVAVELKRFAKAAHGSAWRIDRRHS
ncbi:MAG: DNA-binding response regulator mtrA [Acidimicrobiales bacterium]|jgi:diguanylate cyclase (GGDEF)-like protein|nr:DNA-binding response regulator mtrA [Acidimicrobiales bacterium]